MLHEQAVASGERHACLVTADHELSCSGANEVNQLAAVVATDRFADVAVGSSNTCALSWQRGVQCWGENAFGVVNGPAAAFAAAQWTSVSVGRKHACGVTTDGAGVCWGDNALHAALVSARTAPPACLAHSVLLQVPDTGQTWLQVVAGVLHTCGITANSRDTLCWGGVDPEVQQVPLLGAGERWTQLSAGADFSCGLTTAPRALCWGSNDRMQTVLPAATEGWVQLVTGQYHGCALSAGLSIQCWGDNSLGQIEAPGGSAGPFLRLSAQPVGSSACAWRGGGVTLCWGRTQASALAFIEGAWAAEAALRVAVAHTGALKCAGGLVCGGGLASAGALGAVASGTEVVLARDSVHLLTPPLVLGDTSDVSIADAGATGAAPVVRCSSLCLVVTSSQLSLRRLRLELRPTDGPAITLVSSTLSARGCRLEVGGQVGARTLKFAASLFGLP